MKLRAKKPLRLNYIYNEPCEDTMKRMRDHTVSMVLTSPPYNTSKTTYSETTFKNYESRYDVYIDTGTTALEVKLFNEKYNRDIKYIGSELSQNQVGFANDRISN